MKLDQAPFPPQSGSMTMVIALHFACPQTLCPVFRRKEDMTKLASFSLNLW